MPEVRRKATCPPDEWRALLDKNRAARKRNPNRTTWYRRADLKRYYDITPEEWDAMFEAQGRLCAVCGSPYPGRKNGQWSTDHCHVTKVVRGILCNGCNLALGHVKDDPDRLRMLATYLEEKEFPDVRRVKA